MAAPAVPTGSPIEALFRSSTRFLELRRLPESWTEVELLPGLTIENIWATGVTWKDFCLFLRDKIVWITPDVYVCPLYLDGIGYVLYLGSGDANSMCVRVRSGTATTSASATCDFMVRLLAASEHHDVSISGRNSTVPPPLSGAALSLFSKRAEAVFAMSHLIP
jgi:hypothetical protein